MLHFLKTEPNKTWDDLKTRKGRFYVKKSVMEKDYKLLMSHVFSKTLITRAEYRLFDDVIEYEGVSTLFHPVDVGCVIPEYVFKVHKKGLSPVVTAELANDCT